ncbi:cyclic nucleotide-binding domain-containing protein [Streptomyces hirsutus]|uniref:Cyclic nucleotide-binding domain-containing protein n=1 Tax=Streptomyces hirsutus TaxID=35620 RepID=A0ABZ1GJE6_9ACTN|nr:cyclic nucleotide-binding domain-containing protein [Streptomyces hirsutus]WSD05284.1 cyclic nucleotide-binding domain-containing protein [Streptomyces hirsutus]WTD21323.1 cyclic nucleotide-binding domain-containing protein [Streptomyces hirsutus]WTD73763.1 cyclic nucleotide-binding domain-containing protein [Streptomyces sp. NBC_01635]
MFAPPSPSMPHALLAEHRAKLLETAREVSFPQGIRLFEEGGHADRFWVLRTGTVELDMHVPGRRAAVIERLGHNELVGWSWLYSPHVWHLGAEAATPVRAYEFDAAAVRALCEDEPVLGQDLARWVGRVVAHRLHSARIRLLDLYGPYGAGSGV